MQHIDFTETPKPYASRVAFLASDVCKILEHSNPAIAIRSNDLAEYRDYVVLRLSNNFKFAQEAREKFKMTRATTRKCILFMSGVWLLAWGSRNTYGQALREYFADEMFDRVFNLDVAVNPKESNSVIVSERLKKISQVENNAPKLVAEFLEKIKNCAVDLG